MTISLDAILRLVRLRATNETPERDIFLEIRASCAQVPRLGPRDEPAEMVASSLRTTSEKPVLQGLHDNIIRFRCNAFGAGAARSFPGSRRSRSTDDGRVAGRDRRD